MGARGSLKRELAELREAMRAGGRTWREIAAVISDCHGVNARTALRLAHGWTQAEVADRYNAAWPDAPPKNFRHISYWENWEPGGRSVSSARMPSYEDLDRLAQLYQCSVADLLGGADYGDRDPNSGLIVVTPADVHVHNGTDRTSAPGEVDPTKRRDALKLGLIGAAAPELLHTVLGDAAAEAMEFTRQTATSGVGSGTLEHLQSAMADIHRAYYRDSPAKVFTVARAYRQRVHQLMLGRHTLVEGRELSVQAGWLDDLLGWIALDLGDVRAARAYAIDCYERGSQAEHSELTGWAADLLSAVHRHTGDFVGVIAPVRRAIATVPVATPLSVRLMANAAEIHAELGQKEESEKLLRDAQDGLERLPSKARLRYSDDDEWLSEYCVHCFGARCRLKLGDDEGAKRHAEHSLAAARTASSDYRSRTKEGIAGIELGLSLIRLGGPEEAAALGLRALASADEATLRVRGSRLDAVLKQRYPLLPEAQEFHERYRVLAKA